MAKNGPAEKDRGSLGKAYKQGEQYQADIQVEKDSWKTSNRILAWILGIILALSPLLICMLLSILYRNNETMSNNFSAFPCEFIFSGSFLWLGITLLVTALIDLLLYGFREQKGTQIGYKILVVVSVFTCLIGTVIYFSNIGSPMDDFVLSVVSVAAFLLFAIASGILSFKISKGG